MYIIYTQSRCGYCDMAKELLEAHSQQYTEIPIDVDMDAKNFVKSFAKTVPQIFKDGEYIGGHSDLVTSLQ